MSETTEALMLVPSSPGRLGRLLPQTPWKRFSGHSGRFDALESLILVLGHTENQGNIFVRNLGQEFLPVLSILKSQRLQV